jgi:P27 family predicted phage terminase small subunit
MGRNTKPEELKVLEGTFRKDRQNQNRVIGEKLDYVPDSPDYLTKDQKTHYENVVNTCIELGIMTIHDVYICIETAVVIDELIWSIKDINDNGRVQITQSGYEQVRPICGIRDRALDKFIKLSNLMGMNASAREKLTVEKIEKVNLFDKLLSERN